MIAPMKKLSLVVMESDRDRSLEKLREAGVVHLAKKSVSSDSLSKLLAARGKVGRALAILGRYPFKKGTHAAYIAFTPEDVDLVAHILGLWEEKKILQEQLMYLGKERRRVEGWGDFDPHSIPFLVQHGIKLFPYEIPRLVYERLGDDIQRIVVSRDKKMVRVFSVGAEIPAHVPFAFSIQSLSAMNHRIDSIHQRLQEIEDEYASLAHRKGAIEEEHDRIMEEIEFETARAGMEVHEEESSLCWLNGYVPAEKMGVLKRFAAEQGWALVWEDPAPADRPPTMLKNNPVVRIIRPVFSFLGTIPGYWEYDISPSYLVFFSIFVAMIMGDAAYGLLLFSVSLALGFSLKKKSGSFPDIIRLLLLLSCCTMAWGSMTGSWFAAPHDKLPSFLRALILPPFNNSGSLAEFPIFLGYIFKLPEDVPVDVLKTRWNIQFLCFTVAVSQLVWARGKRIVRLLPSLTAFAQVGMLTLMIGLYFLVLSMLLRIELPSFAIWLIGAGVAFNLIFAEQKGGNFFVNIAKGFSNLFSLFLKSVSCFADIVSYIRLFAVGMAGSTIAQIFNSMALPADGFGSFGLNFLLKLFAAALILAIGHGLNLVLTALSVIVHGVRLNLLEYAGNHLEMEWYGYTYNPFALRQKNKHG